MTRLAKTLICAVLGSAAAGVAIYGLWEEPFLEIPVVGKGTLDGYAFDDPDPSLDRSAIVQITWALVVAAAALCLPRWARLISPLTAAGAGWLCYRALQPLLRMLIDMNAFAQDSGSKSAQHMVEQAWDDTHFLAGFECFRAGLTGLIIMGFVSFFATKAHAASGSPETGKGTIP